MDNGSTMTKASVSDATLREGLALTLDATDLPELGDKYEGKVRDNYTKDGRRTLIVSDRVSAFDRVLGTLPFKGQVLNQLAGWWFEETKSIAPNHMIDLPDPNVLVAHECEPLPVELIMRAYITGVTSTSMWTHYEAGSRLFCGHELPDGLRKHQKLDEPLLTPSTKAERGDHDVSASRAEILAMGRMTAKDFDEAAEMARGLFAHGQKVCAAQGLILVDTKYEIGRSKDGKLMVIDEIHTPDSSRYWYTKSYAERFDSGQDPESFDKEYLRRWLKEVGYSGDGPIPDIPDEVRVEASRRYIEACDVIRGEPFEPNLEPPNARIRKNLGLG